MDEPGFVVTVEGAGLEPEQLEDAARDLRENLREVDQVRIGEVPAGPAPEGTRADVITLAAALAVTYYTGKMAPQTVKDQIVQVAPKLARVLADWSVRHRRTKAVVHRPDGTRIVLDNLSESEIRAVMENVDGSSRVVVVDAEGAVAVEEGTTGTAPSTDRTAQP